MTANGQLTGAQPKERFDPLSPTMADAWMDRSAELRERYPVAWSDAHGGFRVFNRHDDVYGAALNWQLYSSAQGAVPVQYDLDVIRLIPLETDPPLHRNIRRMLNRFFAPEALKPAEGPIADLVGELLDRCLTTSPCDFVQEFASPLPSRVFFRFFLRHDEGTRIPWVLDILDTLFTRPDLAEEKAT